MSFIKNFTPYEFPKLGYIKIPKVTIPPEDYIKYNLPPDCSSDLYLKSLMMTGFENKIKEGKIPADKKDIYLKRLEFEFKEISKLLFTDYILLVYNIINFCNKNGILNSPGRGSAAGSLLLWAIDIVKVDAIKHNLLFERFISSDRTEVKEINGEKYISSKNVPDVDIDSDRSKKHLINEFLESQFPGRTTAIKTFNTLQGKSNIKEVLKCYENFTEDEAKEVSDLIEVTFGKVQEISDAAVSNKGFSDWAKGYEKAVIISQKLNGLIRASGVHASGVMICNDPLEECLPLELSASDNKKVLISAFDMENCQSFGIKVDNLGLKNLEAIKECLDLIGKKLEDIDVNHPSIYKFLNNSNDYRGIFQAEEGLGKLVLKKIKPQNIEDISLSIAIGRPGSLKFLDEILESRENNIKRKLDKRIEPILNKTYNVIVYQESIMSLSKTMAKFSPKDADGLRKGIGKKIVEKVLEYKDKFIKQSIENRFDPDFVNEIWQTFEDSGNYLFNFSHSCAYSYLLAICAYLKANHPTEFFYTMLKNVKHETKPLEEIAAIIEELPNFGIELLPPSLLKSDIDFKIESGNKIRMGLGDIKGVAQKAIDKLRNFKHEYSNKFEIFQSAEECGLNIGIMSALVQAGAMDDFFFKSRSRMVLELQLYRLLTKRERERVLSLGAEFNYDLYNIMLHLSGQPYINNGIKYENKNLSPFIKPSRLETIKSKYNLYKKIYQQNSKNENLACYFFERSFLGFSYSQDIYNILKVEHPDISKVYDVSAELESKQKHTFGGEIMDVIYGTSKAKKNKYVKLKIQDKSGSVNAMMFSDKLSNSEELNGGKFEVGQIVVCEGRKNGDAVFCDSIGRQDAKIFLKLSELKSEN